jgi:mitochondrial fission protein ELM1
LSKPLTWVMLGRKAGDNTQVTALAEELGWDYERKSILARPWELLTHLSLGVTLAGIDRARSSEIAPPWPDLVISAGRRNEPVARWIKQQSGGRTRLVHIGRPWAPLDSYELIVTTPQYFLPQADTIVHNQLPLHRLERRALEQEAQFVQQRLPHLPGPVIAVLVGGDSGRFVFTREKGKRLGQLADRLARESGGSLLLSNSPRTPQAVYDALLEELQVPHYAYHWHPDSDNPYRGFLGLADQFVVTGESMSMLGEAVAMGKPVHVFDMGDGDQPWWRLPHAYRYKPLSYRLGMALGPTRMRRDIGRIQQALVASGRACWLGAASMQESVVTTGGEDELVYTARRVRELFASTAG